MRNEIRDVFFAPTERKVPPLSIRFDLWLKHAKSTGTVPDELKELSYEEAEDYLGFCRTGRFRPNPTIIFNDGDVSSKCEGDLTVEEYCLSGGILRRVSEQTSENRQAGIKGHIIEYPIKTEAECRILAAALKNAEIVFNNDGLNDYILDTGDKGVPIYILNACPAHRIILDWIGYENFFFFQYDFPDTLDVLIKELDKIYRRDLWAAACDVPTEMILHGAHFSASMTPRPIFEKYFLPYFKDFNKKIHSVGKKVLFHSDADLGDLAALVLDAGYDGADCLATDPLVDRNMDDYFKEWGNDMVCWGGLPSVIFDREYSMAEYKEYINRFIDACKGRGNVIAGASDNVMPGTQWEKILYLKEMFVS